MKKWFYNPIVLFLAVLIAACLLSGCSKNTKREKEVREQAIAFLENGDYSAAVARFNEALSYNDGKYGELEIDILKYRAEAEILSGDYPAAANTYNMLMRYDEETPEYQNLRVLCLVRGGEDPTKAVELYRKAEEADPYAIGHQDALYELGRALAATGKREDALTAAELYTAALADENRQTAELYNRMGTMTCEAGDVDGAIGWLKKGKNYLDMHDEDPGNSVRESLDFNMAVCYEKKGDYRKALELFQAYIQEYGTTEAAEHEITFLESRIR